MDLLPNIKHLQYQAPPLIHASTSATALATRASFFFLRQTFFNILSEV
jgi:hypothetical protein